MEVLSTLTIGSNVPRVRVQGTEERVVAALATVWAGCTSAAKKRKREADFGRVKSYLIFCGSPLLFPCYILSERQKQLSVTVTHLG
jgi:hypothetical protein